MLFPTLLLVAGTGRNVGKTSVICKIIEKYKGLQNIVAIKITSHIHTEPGNQIQSKLLFDSEKYKIFKEFENSSKDSGRCLSAGAKDVYYIESDPAEVIYAFEKVLSYMSANSIIICESGILLKYIKPGIFILVTGKIIKNTDTYYEMFNKADIVFESKENNNTFDISKIKIKDGLWAIE